MKIKASDLSGAALDWAVAKCEGIDVEYWCNEGPKDAGIIVLSPLPERGRGYPASFNPSTNWKLAGPIIEREKIVLGYLSDLPCASTFEGHKHYCTEFGPTILIAAMRCYAASKLGSRIEVPDEIPSQELI